MRGRDGANAGVRVFTWALRWRWSQGERMNPQAEGCEARRVWNYYARDRTKQHLGLILAADHTPPRTRIRLDSPCAAVVGAVAQPVAVLGRSDRPVETVVVGPHVVTDFI